MTQVNAALLDKTGSGFVALLADSVYLWVAMTARSRSRSAPDQPARTEAPRLRCCDWCRAWCACADQINRAVPAGRPPEVDLASFWPGVTFGFELGLEFRFGL